MTARFFDLLRWGAKLASAAAGWAARIPGAWLLIVIAALGLWLHGRDARTRRGEAAKIAEHQAAGEISQLGKQAAASEQKANAVSVEAAKHADRVREQAARREHQLESQLAAVRRREQSESEHLAPLPISELAKKINDMVAARGTAYIAQTATYAPPANGMRPAEGGKQWGGSRTALTDQAGGGDTAATDQVAGEKPTAQETVPWLPKQDGDHRSPLQLTDAGVRKIAGALNQLNACRAENKIRAEQLKNCGERATADEQQIEQQAKSIAALNQALAAKDQVIEKQQSAYKTQLKAARGTFWGRVERTGKHVMVGVVIGLAIGVAAR